MWSQKQRRAKARPQEAKEEYAGRLAGSWGLTPWLTGAGARSAEGTDMGHEDAEGMAHVGVRVEPPVRLGRAGAVVEMHMPHVVCVRIERG